MNTISKGYKEQLSTLHASDPGWGTTGRNFAGMVQKIAADYRPEDILDYGCGKQTLSRALPQFHIQGYDPGIPGIDAAPRPHDFVVCTDVLEHIEPDCLDDVLVDLQRVTKEIIFMTVATGPAIAILPDGRNAHLIVEPMKWWLAELWERFDLISVVVFNGSFHVLMKAMKPEGNGAA